MIKEEYGTELFELITGDKYNDEVLTDEELDQLSKMIRTPVMMKALAKSYAYMRSTIELELARGSLDMSNPSHVHMYTKLQGSLGMTHMLVNGLLALITETVKEEPEELEGALRVATSH